MDVRPTTPTRPATPTPPAPSPGSRRTALVGGAVLVIVFGLVGTGLLALVLAARGGAGAQAAATPTADPASFAYAEVRPAPALELTDQTGAPFSLAQLRGRPVLLFFGYTHCPDVCPETVGVVNKVLAATGDGPRAVFTSIDPERDDVAAMANYTRYLPSAYYGLSGTPQAIHENAVRWGIQYAKIEQDSANGYSMAHTAMVFLVDAQGQLRAHFPYQTPPEAIIPFVQRLLAETPPPAASAPVAAGSPTPAPASAPPAATASAPAPPSAPPPSAPASAPPAAVALLPEVISTSIWAGAPDPVILKVVDSTGVKLDGSVPLSVQVTTFDGAPQGAPVTAVPLLPEGETQVSFIAGVTFPGPGAWKLALAAGDARGDITVQALDPGSTAVIGGPAPDIDTPTLDDVGGVVRAVTTQPNPDLRLSQTSTADARAAGRPYVIVIDSARFKVSPACGRALTMVRYLLDRWPDVAFIHLEPFEYRVITEEPVLSGTLSDPPLNPYATAFGLGPDPWPGTQMPWIFVVDGSGIVRAKYTGVVGSADIDVILTQIMGRGAVGG